MNAPLTCPTPAQRTSESTLRGRARLIVWLAGPLCAGTMLAATQWTLVGWNNLGMHCMDSDFSVSAILPPYNTVHAQLIARDTTTRLLREAAGVTVTYEAVADPGGSINRSSIGKGNFWLHATALFGAQLEMDQGLPVPGPESFHMPGLANTPQPMAFEPSQSWFAAYGIPITPYDDAGRHNPYPLLQLVARDRAGTILATARVVVPVSDEMDCKLCHASGTSAAAEPASGWVWEADQGRDYRLNILRLHDDLWRDNPEYTNALASAGFNRAGLHTTAVADRHPILCAACHPSEALPGSGQPGIKPLTEAVHTLHAFVADPRSGLMLNDAGNRTACYTCHPGSVTRCLRGAMGSAVGADGSMAMQCQNCHGSMTDVGSATRTGWLDEPNCQACHSGDAIAHSGQLRFTSAFEAPGRLRVPANTRFATLPNTPAPGKSLYRFSTGHGGLQCSACHGSTHAEYPAAFPNDNLQSQDHQGHAGMLAECTVCHASAPSTASGGPHGLHTLGNTWVSRHGDLLEASGGPAPCRACHGLDYRGTVLSRALGDRTLATEFGSRTLWRGAQVSCYLCHNGPNSESPSPNAPPVVTNPSATPVAGAPTTLTLPATDPNGNPFSLRVVTQPVHGTVALRGSQATYLPEPGYVGPDAFTFAAHDGLADSNLGRATLDVTALDADEDGVPDWWCFLQFGHPTGRSDDLSRATDDPDGDQASNADEARAGTDPHRSVSALRSTGGRITAAGWWVGFNTALGRQYTVLAADALPGTDWSVVATNIWGHPDSLEVLDAVGVGRTRRFYRVQLQP